MKEHYRSHRFYEESIMNFMTKISTTQTIKIKKNMNSSIDTKEISLYLKAFPHKNKKNKKQAIDEKKYLPDKNPVSKICTMKCCKFSKSKTSQ